MKDEAFEELPTSVRQAGRVRRGTEKDSRVSTFKPADVRAVREKRSPPGEIVVFWIIRDSVCAECGEELGKGRFLRMEAERPLCLACADLDHLVFLPSGDAALTRRATRNSTLRAVVVRFSRTRTRFERQGVLVEESALTRAEEECLSDAQARHLARERTAERRQELDAEYVEKFARRVGDLFPDVRATNNERSPSTRARSIRVESAVRLSNVRRQPPNER